MLMTEVMMEVKKLRTLQRKGSELERTKVVDKTRKYLVSHLATYSKFAGHPAALPSGMQLTASLPL